MFRMKYMDGAPVDPEYAKAVGSLVAGAAAATEIVSEDEMEAHAASLKEHESDEGFGV